MAIFVITDAQVTINSQDLTSYVQSVTVTYEKDQIEVTSMSSGGAHVYDGGLQSNSIAVELQNDEAANKTMLTLWDAVGSGANTVVVKNTTSGATFTLSNAYLQASTPVNGAVGDLSVQSVTFTGGSLVKS